MYCEIRGLSFEVGKSRNLVLTLEYLWGVYAHQIYEVNAKEKHQLLFQVKYFRWKTLNLPNKQHLPQIMI